MVASTASRRVAHRTGHAMGSVREVRVVGSGHSASSELARLLDVAEAHVARLENLWSRFIPTSDICRLNAADGADVIVDSATVELVTMMVHAHRATDGAFDPTLLPALLALGYDASWDDASMVTTLPPDTTPGGALDDVLVDADACVVRLPRGMALDAGGIGKGLAADRVAMDLLSRGAAGALVNLGGDVRVAGEAPQDGGWAVGVDNLAEGATDAQVRLMDGGIATSGTDRRRWIEASGRQVHHLLDPHTLMPTPLDLGSSVVGATVIAGSASWAEVWTKALMVSGDDALPLLEAHGLAGRTVHRDGTTFTTGNWHQLALAHGRDR